MPRSGSASSASRQSVRRRSRRSAGRCRSSAASSAGPCAQAHPGPPCRARRHGRAGDARPPAARRARVGHGGAEHRPARGRDAADARRTGQPRRRRDRGAAVRCDPAEDDDVAAVVSGRRADTGGTALVAMTIDLSPYLDAVPDVVVERLRGARRVLAVGAREPRCRHARGHARRRSSRRGLGRQGGSRLHGSGAAAVRLPRRHRAVPDRPGPGRRIRPARAVRLRRRSIGSARSAVRHARRCSIGCHVSSSTITPRTRRSGTPTGSNRAPLRRARW